MALSFMIPWSIDGTGSYILFFIWVGNNAHDKMKRRATARRAWLQHDSVWHSTGTQRVQFFLERFFFLLHIRACPYGKLRGSRA